MDVVLSHTFHFDHLAHPTGQAGKPSHLFDIPDRRGKYGLVRNIGLDGVVVVSLLRRPSSSEPAVRMVEQGMLS